jgi:hypothetical protein
MSIKNSVILTLSNGLRVASFNNNKNIMFADGQTLRPIDGTEFKKLKVNYHTIVKEEKGIQHIRTVYFLSPYQLDAIKEWQKAYEDGTVDVVIAPMQFMTALIQSGWTTDQISESPFRTVYMENKEHNIVDTNKFVVPF